MADKIKVVIKKKNKKKKPETGRPWWQATLETTWKIIKWPLIIAVPVGVFTLSAWWSLIGALSSDVLSVPELRGKTIEEANFILSSRSLKLEIDENGKFSQEIDKGLVLESIPAEGARIKRGRSVRVILSEGFKRAMVPNLELKSIREAELLGRQFGFRIREKDQVYSEIVPVGHIIAQEPAPDTAFVTDSLNVLVSKGPHPKLVMVPDLIGKPLLPVLEDLRSKGLPFNVRKRGENRDISNSDPFQLRQLQIYRQWPSSGSFIDLRTPETIILRVDWTYK